jgi:2-iminobutanoate/2-iminopropanoate deaminase
MFEAVDTGISTSARLVSGTVRRGPLIMTAQIPKDPVSGELITGDIEAQTRRLFDNMRIALEAAGGTLADVMQVLVYLVDRDDGNGMNKVYGEFFTKAPFPNRATVIVKELMRPSMKIEVLATAYIDPA